MKIQRLTFFDPTNLTLPYIIYLTLEGDAKYFGYIKNGKPNISGFLNNLIPRLADYRDDLHYNLLVSNNYDEELTTKIEESIYKIYFNKYDYCDDGITTVPFRVNKEHLQDFLNIYDNKLSKYNMDFTNFVRSLLIEYSSKRLNQREYFFYYREITKIKNAIENNILCYFHTDVERSYFVPVSIELSELAEENLIVGYNPKEETAYILPLASVRKIVISSPTQPITSEDCAFIYDALDDYYKNIKENKQCLD